MAVPRRCDEGSAERWVAVSGPPRPGEERGPRRPAPSAFPPSVPSSVALVLLWILLLVSSVPLLYCPQLAESEVRRAEASSLFSVTFLIRSCIYTHPHTPT